MACEGVLRCIHGVNFLKCVGLIVLCILFMTTMKPEFEEKCREIKSGGTNKDKYLNDGLTWICDNFGTFNVIGWALLLFPVVEIGAVIVSFIGVDKVACLWHLPIFVICTMTTVLCLGLAITMLVKGLGVSFFYGVAILASAILSMVYLVAIFQVMCRQDEK